MLLSKDNARRKQGKGLNAQRYAWCAEGGEVNRANLRQQVHNATGLPGYQEKLARAQARKMRQKV